MCYLTIVPTPSSPTGLLSPGKFFVDYFLFSWKETDEDMTIYAILEFFPLHNVSLFKQELNKVYATLYCERLDM